MSGGHPKSTTGEYRDTATNGQQTIDSPPECKTNSNTVLHRQQRLQQQDASMSNLWVVEKEPFDEHIISLMPCDADIRGPFSGPPFVFCNDVHPPSQFIVVTSIHAQTLSLRITVSPKRRSVSRDTFIDLRYKCNLLPSSLSHQLYTIPLSQPPTHPQTSPPHPPQDSPSWLNHSTN